MAITYLGCKNSLSSDQLPSDYIRPNIVEFKDYEYLRSLSFVITKKAIESKKEIETLENLFLDLNKKVLAIIKDDFSKEKNMICFSDLIQIKTNIQETILTNKEATIEAVVNLYIKLKNNELNKI